MLPKIRELLRRFHVATRYPEQINELLSDEKPRAPTIEYNGSFRSSAVWIREQHAGTGWNGTNYYGASLKALELLGQSKGYVLAGCDFSGNNAFFVREDLIADHFCSPFTAENHYEPPRHFLLWRSGYRRDWGKFRGEVSPHRVV